MRVRLFFFPAAWGRKEKEKGNASASALPAARMS